MDTSTDFATQLRDLADGVGSHDGSLTDTLDALATDLQVAVSSYSGLRLTLVHDGWPVTLTAFPGADQKAPAASLRVALSMLGGGFDPQSEIVLYARTPGAFVDLAADLAYSNRYPAGVALDGDLPPVSVASGLSGLTEYSVINRAVGLLMGRGESPDQALGTLRRDASAAGLSLPGYGARLLEE